MRKSANALIVILLVAAIAILSYLPYMNRDKAVDVTGLDGTQQTCIEKNRGEQAGQIDCAAPVPDKSKGEILVTQPDGTKSICLKSDNGKIDCAATSDGSNGTVEVTNSDGTVSLCAEEDGEISCGTPAKQ